MKLFLPRNSRQHDVHACGFYVHDCTIMHKRRLPHAHVNKAYIETSEYAHNKSTCAKPCICQEFSSKKTLKSLHNKKKLAVIHTARESICIIPVFFFFDPAPLSLNTTFSSRHNILLVLFTFLMPQPLAFETLELACEGVRNSDNHIAKTIIAANRARGWYSRDP